MQKEIRTLTVGIILAAVLGLFGIWRGALTVLPGPDSKEALHANAGEARAFEHGLLAKDSFFLLLGHDKYSVSDPKSVECRESIVTFLREQKDKAGLPIFASIKTLGHSWSKDSLFVSDDSKHLLLLANSERPVYELPPQVKELPERIREWQKSFPDFSLSFSSNAITNNEVFDLINHDLDTSLIYTIPITVLVLLLAFRSIAAALVTILLTAISLVCALGFSALLSHVFGPISATAAQLVVLLVMAVGTDYALFFISRMRQEVAKGLSYDQAISMTQRTTGVAIFWSGITVAISLLGLLLTRDSILSSMAVVSVFSVMITLGYTLRLLPALLRLMQGRIEKGRIQLPLVFGSGKSNSWILWSTRHPIAAVVSSSCVLIGLAALCLQLRLGSTMRPELFPDPMPTSGAYKELSRDFPDMTGTDLSLIVYAPDLERKESAGQLQEFLDVFQQSEQVRGPIAIEWSADRQVARYRYSIVGTSVDLANVAFVEDITRNLIPELARTHGIEAALSGKLVYDLEQNAVYAGRTGAVIAAVLFVSLIFLLIAFESIVVPLKALALNLASTGASFGLLVLFFQMYGWKYGVIESFVPSLLFSVLFGLSMDYHLFLISSIQEEVRRGSSTTEAVRAALQSTYAVISSAAAIMASVFLVISCLELPLMKQLGLGLAFAVVLDATLIRCVLLPASMVLLGEWNWYMPKSLSRRIEQLKAWSE
ncbi:MAG: MMPL family transporter [Deltaproteobacteria bacterium]|nr:MMPL family transporter [Deltaproteobacteria bacterium]